MGNRIVTDSEALSATRNAITQFSDNIGQVKSDFSQYFSQANSQIELFVIRLKDRINDLIGEISSLEKELSTLSDELVQAERKQDENDDDVDNYDSDLVIQLEKQMNELEYKKNEIEDQVKKLCEYEKEVSDKFILFQDQQSSILNLLNFDGVVDPETVVSYIDKAITKLENYRAVGLDVDVEINEKRGRAKVLRR